MKPRKIATTPSTLLEALKDSFDESLRSPEGTADPVALLWTDVDSQWRSLVSTLVAVVPQLYSLGSYNRSTRTGPAIWLKCIVDRTLAEDPPPPDMIPILYLPGVSRQELRAAGDCPPSLRPLVELQYRGCVWHQKNGRDWTVEAFLVADQGLGLDIAQDLRTRQATLRALPLLAETAIEGLRGRRLDADDFDKLSVHDPVRDLLRWLSSPEQFRKGWDDGRWQSFCNVCQSEFGLNPDEQGAAGAGRALAIGGGRWDQVWERFCEAPALYPGISGLLRQPMPGQGRLTFDASRRPAQNDDGEGNLLRELQKLADLPHGEACERVRALEVEHGIRRTWVWAKLGESPLAQTLEPMARLASLAKSPLGGEAIDSMAKAYATDGWRCDLAALEALQSGEGSAHSKVIAKVVRTLYEPWVEASARQFQALAAKSDSDLRDWVSSPPGERDTCILFADGLRFDLGRRLQEKLEARLLKVHLHHRIAPLPTVTATAKPVATPAHEALEGDAQADDFTPRLTTTKKPASGSNLREELGRYRIQVLEGSDVGSSSKNQLGGWAEIGRLDERGHQMGAYLVSQVDRELDGIADRAMELLSAGWQRVRIVTDHGWLLLPGGLPKVELPSYLVATKWSRCAVVRGQSSVSMPTYGWYWNRKVRIVSPPGIACFVKGQEYAHGGVSLQECVVPELVVERGLEATKASITGVQWRGMRCRVVVQSNDPSIRADLRLNWKQENSSIVASVKEIGESDEVSLVVEDDIHEGASATVVLVDSAGNVLDRESTTVGELS